MKCSLCPQALSGSGGRRSHCHHHDDALHPEVDFDGDSNMSKHKRAWKALPAEKRYELHAILKGEDEDYDLYFAGAIAAGKKEQSDKDEWWMAGAARLKAEAEEEAAQLAEASGVWETTTAGPKHAAMGLPAEYANVIKEATEDALKAAMPVVADIVAKEVTKHLVDRFNARYGDEETTTSSSASSKKRRVHSD